ALADGVNFALLCRHGTSVRLVLYDLDGAEPVAELNLDPRKNRTGDHWPILVAGLPKVFRYGWRVDGPPGAGHRFDPSLVLLDPASTALSPGAVWGAGMEREPNGAPRALLAAARMHKPPPRRATLRRSL